MTDRELREKLAGARLAAPVGARVEWWEPSTGKTFWQGVVAAVCPKSGKLTVTMDGRRGRKHFTANGTLIAHGQVFCIPRALRVLPS